MRMRGGAHERGDWTAQCQALESRLGHRFADAELLQRALTHRSFSSDHNERLEFLGDAVIGLTVADLLYRKLGVAGEGELSRLRAHLVREESLHRLALDFGLPPLLRLGAGEAGAGGRARASILADALEAVIGAVYVDSGFGAAQRAVGRLFAAIEITPELATSARDPKTTLQEWLQARGHALPVYEVVRITGAAHQQTFEVRCRVAALQHDAAGHGRSRRAAEQEAAAAVVGWIEKRCRG